MKHVEESALYQIAREDKQLAKKAELDVHQARKRVSFGSQIRSATCSQPYTMVNDHRTELKIPDVQRGDGWCNLDPFIEAFLKQIRRTERRSRLMGPMS